MKKINEITLTNGKFEISKGFINLNTDITGKLEHWEDSEVLFDFSCSKVEEVKNLGFMLEFIEDVLCGNPFVKPLQIGTIGNYKDVLFSINDEYVLHIMMREDGKIYPVLFNNKGTSQNLIQFSYSGVDVENFFNEIRKDIISLWEDIDEE